MTTKNELYHLKQLDHKTMKTSEKPLQPNPFTTYRDPETGRWIVVKDQQSSRPSEEKVA